GATVNIADDVHITTRADNGDTGTWLIDPQDFTIADSGGDITGVTLSNQLANNNVEIESVNGATAGNGDIFVNDTVSWSENTLTLSAERDIHINEALHASGSAGLALEYGKGSASAKSVAVTPATTSTPRSTCPPLVASAVDWAARAL